VPAAEPPARGALLVDQLVTEIRTRVMTGELPIGSWLRQEALAAEFNVSRMPVREALRKLEAAEILELIPNRGALVRGPRVQDVRDSYVVRADLEGLAAEIAATRITEEQLAELRDAERRFARAARAQLGTEPGSDAFGRSEWIGANDTFHTVVQRASGNPRLERTILDLHSIFPRFLTSQPLIEDPSRFEPNIEEHRRVRAALEQRDPAESRAAMTAHVLHAGELVADWFARRERALSDLTSPAGPRPRHG
jgi:DNA-binding GntR family transcriptional regulator